MIVKSGPGTFLSLAVYDNYIFWSDWGRRAILRSNKYTGGDTKVLRSDIPHQPMGIIAVANDTNSCKLQRKQIYFLIIYSQKFLCVLFFLTTIIKYIILMALKQLEVFMVTLHETSCLFACVSLCILVILSWISFCYISSG